MSITHCKGFKSFRLGFGRIEESVPRQYLLDALPTEMNLGGLPVRFRKLDRTNAIEITLGSEQIVLTGEQVKEFWKRIEKLAQE